jgi:hypothetical protein
MLSNTATASSTALMCLGTLFIADDLFTVLPKFTISVPGVAGLKLTWRLGEGEPPLSLPFFNVQGAETGIPTIPVCNYGELYEGNKECTCSNGIWRQQKVLIAGARTLKMKCLKAAPIGPLPFNRQAAEERLQKLPNKINASERLAKAVKWVGDGIDVYALGTAIEAAKEHGVDTIEYAEILFELAKAMRGGQDGSIQKLWQKQSKMLQIITTSTLMILSRKQK